MKKLISVTFFLFTLTFWSSSIAQDITNKYNQQDLKYKTMAILPIDGYSDIYLTYLLYNADDRVNYYHIYRSIIFGNEEDVIKKICLTDNYDSLNNVYTNCLFIEDENKLKDLVDKFTSEQDGFDQKFTSNNEPGRYDIDSVLITSIGALLKVDALFAVYVYEVHTGETTASKLDIGAPNLKTKCWLAYAVVDTKTKHILHFGNEKNKETKMMNSSFFGNYYTGTCPSLSYTVMGALENVIAAYPDKIDKNYPEDLFKIFNEKKYEEYCKNPEKIKELVAKNKALINTKDAEGNTVLHYAVAYNNEDAVKIFLDNGAIADAKNNIGHTPLMIAADTGFTKIAGLLITNGADVNCVDKYDESPLLLAAENGQYEMVELLVNDGSDIKQTDYKKQTALLLAAAKGYEKIVNFLISKGADITNKNFFGADALFCTSVFLKSKTLENLIKAGANVNTKNCINTTPLISVLELNDSTALRNEIVKLLLDNGAKPDATDLRGKSPLILATTYGNEKAVEMLLSKGANPDIKDSINNETPLQIAVENKYDKIAEYLISKKSNVNIKNDVGISPLMMACNSGDFIIFNLLIKNGANINDKDDNGQTALMKACQLKDEKTAVDMLTALIAGKAAINAKDDYAYTGLMYASVAGNQETVKYLLPKSANINIADNDGYDALLLTIKLSEYERNNSHTEIIKQLVNSKTDINYCNNAGITPFTGAVIKNWNKEVLDLLIAKGAKVNIKDKDGKTAMDYCSNGKIRKYLKSKGALKGKKVKTNEYATPITSFSQTTDNSSSTANTTIADSTAITKTNNAVTQNTVNTTNSSSTNTVTGTNTTVNTTTTNVSTTQTTTGVSTTNNSTVPNNTVIATTSEKKFFIIAGSYATEQLANDAVAALKTEGFTDAVVVGKNDYGSFRIAYKGYATKEDATKDLTSIKQSANSSAWIFEKK